MTDIPSRIKKFNAAREQSLLFLKYKAMAESPFRFFRGTSHLFYEDLLKSYPFPTSPSTWICGDLHIENFGSYKGENRLVYFDMNDFDEALQAPLLYEICRLVVSVEIAAAAIQFSKIEKKNIIAHLLLRYRDTLIKSKSRNIERATATGLIKKLISKVAERKERDLLLSRTNNKPKNGKLLLSERLHALQKKEKEQLTRSFTAYFGNKGHKGYKATDAGIRIAGTGSIGVKRYLLLMEKENNPKQKKLVDIKQAVSSCILNYCDLNAKQPNWQHDAERIIEVQQMMQHIAPAFLSTFQYENNWYVVREIQPTADKININQAVKQPRQVEKYLSDLAMLTASAQLRSSGRMNAATADELKDFAKAENWLHPLLQWTAHYAQQVTRDYNDFRIAFREGYFKQ